MSTIKLLFKFFTISSFIQFICRLVINLWSFSKVGWSKIGISRITSTLSVIKLSFDQTKLQTFYDIMILMIYWSSIDQPLIIFKISVVKVGIPRIKSILSVLKQLFHQTNLLLIFVYSFWIFLNVWTIVQFLQVIIILMIY